MRRTERALGLARHDNGVKIQVKYMLQHQIMWVEILSAEMFFSQSSCIFKGHLSPLFFDEGGPYFLLTDILCK